MEIQSAAKDDNERLGKSEGPSACVLSCINDHVGQIFITSVVGVGLATDPNTSDRASAHVGVSKYKRTENMLCNRE